MSILGDMLLVALAQRERGQEEGRIGKRDIAGTCASPLDTQYESTREARTLADTRQNGKSEVMSSIRQTHIAYEITIPVNCRYD